MRFEFSTATRIVFGAGTVREVVPAAKGLGRRTLITLGCPTDLAAPLLTELDCCVLAVAGEPTLDLVRQGVETARQERCDVIIGFGGGSAIDAGKATAALMTNPGDVLDYLEVIGAGRALSAPSAPFIAVPTTAGTGAEVTRNAVLASPEHRVKASLRSPLMLARLAVVDPELTFEAPSAVTASTGLDALTQLIEPFVFIRANPMTDLFCREGIERAAGALVRAYGNGRDLAARTDMAWASLLGGLALANAGLGAAHGFAAPIGGLFDAPHGAVCAALLPHVMEVNIRALRARVPGGEALRRYDTVARLLTGRPEATAGDGVAWVADTCRALRIPPLGSYGIGEEHVATVLEHAVRSSSMKGNPIELAPQELREVLTRAL